MSSQPGTPRPSSADPARGARSASAGLRVELRALVNVGGEAFLGPGRVELLDAVRSAGSLSAAARALGMSYRKAWVLMTSMNRAVGAPLADLATGGAGGGGARLTPLGARMLRAFRRLEADAERLRTRMEGRLAAVVAGAGGAVSSSRSTAGRDDARRMHGRSSPRGAGRAAGSPAGRRSPRASSRSPATRAESPARPAHAGPARSPRASSRSSAGGLESATRRRGARGSRGGGSSTEGQETP